MALANVKLDDELRGAYILAADTVVAVGRRILPKAELLDEAAQCLRLLSGRNHRVYTSICLVTPKEAFRQRLVETRVRFKRLSDEDIEAYLASGEWRGKAGGYAAQGIAGTFIVKLVGSYIERGRPAAVRDHEPARRRGLSRSASAGSTRRDANLRGAGMNLALWLYRAGLSHPRCRRRRRARAWSRPTANWPRAQRAWPAHCAIGSKLKPGDRVAIAAKNSPDYLELLYGIWHAGLAAVPANAKLHGAELGYILEQSGARVCFASDGIDAEIAPHAPRTLERLIAIGSAEYEALFAADPIAVVPRAPDDLAWLFYTSGTTGRPKGAMLTHRNLAMASLAYGSEVDPVTPGDAILHAAPMSHGSGLYIMQHVARLGVQVVPESGGFEPEEDRSRCSTRGRACRCSQRPP